MTRGPAAGAGVGLSFSGARRFFTGGVLTIISFNLSKLCILNARALRKKKKHNTIALKLSSVHDGLLNAGFNLFYQIVVYYTPEVSISNPGDANTNCIAFFTQICLKIKYLHYKIL